MLDKAKLVGKELCQAKTDYKEGVIFYGLFVAPKIKHVLSIDNLGIIHQHMTFEGFNDSKSLSDRSQYFNMLQGKKITTMLPRSWKKSLNNGVIIPV